MSTVARIVVFVAGSGLVLFVLRSAIRTVVLPRGDPVMLTRLLFVGLKVVFDLRLKRVRTYERRDRAMAFYAPLGLVLLPGTWVALVITGFTGVLWGLGVDPLRRAFAISGWSLTTLGTVGPDDLPAQVATFVEATLGLGIVALLISYLPSIYTAFQRRELAVARMVTLAGTPPSAVAMLLRFHALEHLTAIDDIWEDWETWFDDIEETHTSQPSLVWFRSIDYDRSWVTAAGAVLDTAAFRAAVLDLPRSPQAELCLRSGYLALQRIAAYYTIPFDPAPRRGDPVAVDRSEFDQAYERLARDRVPLRADRELAWQDWAGWRVNYDRPLVGLAGLVMAPYAEWSSDRSLRYRRRPLTQRGHDRSANSGTE